jgi:Fur family ferric uptake transcriptional regulator
MNTQVESLSNTLQESGYRLTPARARILATLVASGGHLTADELAERVRSAAPNVGRMTVYRTLDLLCELGRIRPIFQGSGAAHFVLMQGGSHHHLICNRCNTVIEFDHCQATELARVLGERHQFRVHGHLLEIHGLCANCQD